LKVGASDCQAKYYRENGLIVSCSRVVTGWLTEGRPACGWFVETRTSASWFLWRETPMATASLDFQGLLPESPRNPSTSSILVRSCLQCFKHSFNSRQSLCTSLTLPSLQKSSFINRSTDFDRTGPLQYEASTECLLCTSTNCGNGC